MTDSQAQNNDLKVIVCAVLTVWVLTLIIAYGMGFANGQQDILKVMIR